MFLFPVRDVAGNFPVRLVYTVPLVSVDRNAMKTLSDFASGSGDISSSPRLLSSLCVYLTCFCFRSKWPFAVDIDSSRYVVTSLLFIAGHVTTWLQRIARNQVDFTGLNRAVWRNSIMDFFELICSRLKFLFSPSEIFLASCCRLNI